MSAQPSIDVYQDHAKLAREGDWKFMWERLGNFPLQPREYTLTQLPVSGAPAHSIRFTGPQAFPQGVSMTECMEGGRMLNGDELIQEFGELEHIELWINARIYGLVCSSGIDHQYHSGRRVLTGQPRYVSQVLCHAEVLRRSLLNNTTTS